MTDGRRYACWQSFIFITIGAILLKYFDGCDIIQMRGRLHRLKKPANRLTVLAIPLLRLRFSIPTEKEYWK